MLCAAAQSLSFSPGGAGAPARIDRDVQQIVAGQAALLRVATLVARGVCHEELFAVVNQELAQLPGADAAALLRFEPDETITLLAAWNPAGAPAPAGEREPVNAALRRLRDTARPIAVRADGRPAHRTIHRRDPAPRDPRVGGSTDPGRRPRMGDQRGRIAEPGAVPPATETRIAEFTELVATAISNGTPAPSWRPPARHRRRRRVRPGRRTAHADVEWVSLSDTVDCPNVLIAAARALCCRGDPIPYKGPTRK
jgi:hypothetical protein